MKRTVDFYFDYGSPTSYLADTQLPAICARHEATLNYVPVLLGGIFQATGNRSPVTVPAKGAYMLADMQRFADRYGVKFVMNPHFPVNTLHLMRGAVAAQRLGCFGAYHAAVFHAMWAAGANLGDTATVGATLQRAGIDTAALLPLLDDPGVKETLKDNTARAIERGAFGAPTMFVGDSMFFGQDRLDFVEQALSRR